MVSSVIPGQVSWRDERRAVPHPGEPVTDRRRRDGPLVVQEPEPSPTVDAPATSPVVFVHRNQSPGIVCDVGAAGATLWYQPAALRTTSSRTNGPVTSAWVHVVASHDHNDQVLAVTVAASGAAGSSRA